MQRNLLLIVFLLSCASRPLAIPTRTNPTSAFDRYGRISWENEKARLDNFAIQLMMEPDYIGYFLVRVGKLSCKGDAQAHALRAKNYLMHVRHIPWNRIIWRDTGFGDEFQVIIWLVPRGGNLTFEYDAATSQHVIRNCHRNALNHDAHNKIIGRERRERVSQLA